MSCRGSTKRRRRRSCSEHPPVYFKRQPFFEVLAILLHPTRLRCRGGRGGRHSHGHKCLHFQFMAHHVNDIFTSLSRNTLTGSEYGVQVHLRFCLNDDALEQDDSYPADLTVKVNSQSFALPASIPVQEPYGVTARVHLPINIVSSCFLYPAVKNRVSVSWRSEGGREYAAGVFLVRKHSTATILRELRHTSVQNMTVTRELIKKVQQLANGEDVAVTSLHVSLTCPLSKKRMCVPCRAVGCKHVQCFDAPSYLQVNETRPTWVCPVCGRRAEFSSLVIDQLFMHIVEKAPRDCDSVVFRQDGSWAPSAPRRDRCHDGPGRASSSTARGWKGTPKSSSSEEAGRANKRRKTKFVDLTVDVIDLTENSGDEADGRGADVRLQTEHASDGNDSGDALSVEPSPPDVVRNDVSPEPECIEVVDSGFDLRKVIL
ncbi:hypothetical protein HPB50_023557 [Hyalomma asiaticum]|uniref:Uncharacterized protein n=1 Tax=Hyalomma asiaticum TaxID=266040 RepID=A0ACB7SBN0_HYAAI|nr:hypothetical protein HPB50_023557 [Hyalomma asiaticum]